MRAFFILFIIQIVCLSCTLQPTQPNSKTTDTTVAALSNLGRNEEQPLRVDSTAVPLSYLYDSLERNIATGILNGDPKALPHVKFVLYAYDRSEEYGLKLGDSLNGYFADGQSGLLTRYRPSPVATEFDSVNQWLTFPLFPESQWPAFLLKGFNTTDVKGKLNDWEFFEPGDSITINLGGNAFFLHVEGTTVGYVVRNYKLYLESTIHDRHHKELLLGHKYLPFVNATDIIPDFIYWLGDLNNDNILDLITGDGSKSCSTLRLWIGNKDFKFEQKARFYGCGC